MEMHILLQMFFLFSFVVSTDPESMKAAAGSLDLILNTVSAEHQVGWDSIPFNPPTQASTYLSLLAKKGVLVQLGLVLSAHQVNQMPLMFNKLSIAGSLIGGLPETQECIDFCAEHNIVPKTKMVKSTDLDDVYKQLNTKNDTILRNVLDIDASKAC